MSEQCYLEAMINGQQVQAGIAVAIGLGVIHFRDISAETVTITTEEIFSLLRDRKQIAISDPDGVLNTGPGVKIGETSKRWIERGDYAQAALLLGAQTVDVMRQILKK